MKITLFLLIFSIFSSCEKNVLPKVLVNTAFGDIIFEIDTVHAPVSAKNFLHHIDLGTFDDAVFYRTVTMDNQPNNEVKIEVIQGGVFSEDRLAEIKPIQHETTEETGLKHLDGSLSMARAAVGTASTEFFICIGKQPELDFSGKRNPDEQGFAVFGKVIKGMDVVRKIQQQKEKGQYLVEPVKILNIKGLKKGN